MIIFQVNFLTKNIISNCYGGAVNTFKDASSKVKVGPALNNNRLSLNPCKNN